MDKPQEMAKEGDQKDGGEGAPEEEPAPRKVSVRIIGKLAAEFRLMMDKACVRRDAYLAKVLAVELDRLEEELSFASSKHAKAYVAKQLDATNRELVTFVLPGALIERLDDICKRKRVNRESFFNRLLLLLWAPEPLVDNLLFGGDDEWRKVVWSERRNDGHWFDTCFNPLRGKIDPLWGLHTGMAIYNDGAFEEVADPNGGRNTVRAIRDPITQVLRPPLGVYTTPLRKHGLMDLTGLNCFFSDADIPYTDTHAEAEKRMDDFANLLL